jgi:hypothetical protein
MNIPAGHTLETLMQSKAGRVYLAARTIPTARHTWNSAIDYVVPGDFPEHVETCNPPHPECYAYMFDDDSILIVSNGEDEVWTHEIDYMEANDLNRGDHPTHGWMYYPRTEPIASDQWHAYANRGEFANIVTD